jgi:hypothetical protein
LKNKVKGIAGQPLTATYTGVWNVNPFVDVKGKLDIQQDTIASASWS